MSWAHLHNVLRTSGLTPAGDLTGSSDRPVTGIAYDTAMHTRYAAFREALAQLGWTEDRNLQIDYRWGSGSADRIRKNAVELAALAPDAILATGGASVAGHSTKSPVA